MSNTKKIPVFLKYQENGKTYIERKKYPKFRIEVRSNNLIHESIEFFDPIHDPLTQQKLIHKADEFLRKRGEEK